MAAILAHSPSITNSLPLLPILYMVISNIIGVDATFKPDHEDVALLQTELEQTELLRRIRDVPLMRTHVDSDPSWRSVLERV